MEFEWNIDITTPQFSIFNKPLIDVTYTELDGFIEGMCMQFYNAGYKLINKPRYAYELDHNSINLFFEKFSNSIKKKVNVGIRISEFSENKKVDILFNQKNCSNYCNALFYVRELIFLLERL